MPSVGGLPAHEAVGLGDAEDGGVPVRRYAQGYARVPLRQRLRRGEIQEGVGGVDPEPLVAVPVRLQRPAAGAGHVAHVHP